MLRTNGKFLPVVRPNDKSGQGWADYQAGRPYDPAYDGRTRSTSATTGGAGCAPQAHIWFTTGPGAQAWDIIAKTNGLRLIPPAAGQAPPAAGGISSTGCAEAAMNKRAECNYCTLQALKRSRPTLAVRSSSSLGP